MDEKSLMQKFCNAIKFLLSYINLIILPFWSKFKSLISILWVICVGDIVRGLCDDWN